MNQLNSRQNALQIVLEKMQENETKINDTGFHLCCKILKSNHLMKLMKFQFNLGYVPKSDSIFQMLKNRYTMTKCIQYIIENFNFEITPELQKMFLHKGMMIKNSRFHKLNLEQIEEYCRKFPVYKFLKDIPDDIKLSQNCLYYAFSLDENENSIKILINQFYLQPNRECLNLILKLEKFEYLNFIIDPQLNIKNM